MTPINVALKDAQHALQRFEIRPLTAEDAPAYFALRQRVLKMGDGHYFSDSYIREAALTTDQQRRDWCAEKREHCIIGAFANGVLSGIVMITRFGPPADSTVEWEAAWVDPRYRRTGLTKAIYQQVQQWTMDHGYSFVKVFIRADNARWLDIRRRQGFVEIGSKRDEVWADGTIGDTRVFRLDLRASASHTPQLLPERETTSSVPAHLRPPIGDRRFG